MRPPLAATLSLLVCLPAAGLSAESAQTPAVAEAPRTATDKAGGNRSQAPAPSAQANPAVAPVLAAGLELLKSIAQAHGIAAGLERKTRKARARLPAARVLLDGVLRRLSAQPAMAGGRGGLVPRLAGSRQDLGASLRKIGRAPPACAGLDLAGALAAASGLRRFGLAVVETGRIRRQASSNAQEADRALRAAVKWFWDRDQKAAALELDRYRGEAVRDFMAVAGVLGKGLGSKALRPDPGLLEAAAKGCVPAPAARAPAPASPESSDPCFPPSADQCGKQLRSDHQQCSADALAGRGPGLGTCLDSANKSNADCLNRAKQPPPAWCKLGGLGGHDKKLDDRKPVDKGAVPAATLSAAMALLRASAEGKAVAAFLDRKDAKGRRVIPINFDSSLPAGTLARYDSKGRRIWLNVNVGKAKPAELAAVLGHEGFHAMRHKAGTMVSSIEDEQDATFLQLAIYHEMVRARPKSRLPRGNPLEDFYRGTFRPEAKNLKVTKTSDYVGNFYSNAGYRTLDEQYRTASPADRALIDLARQEHAKRQQWVNEWLRKHRKEF